MERGGLRCGAAPASYADQLAELVRAVRREQTETRARLRLASTSRADADACLARLPYLAAIERDLTDALAQARALEQRKER